MAFSKAYNGKYLDYTKGGSIVSRYYEDGHLARTSLGRYFRMYNTERRHQGLGKRTPKDVHFSIT